MLNKRLVRADLVLPVHLPGFEHQSFGISSCRWFLFEDGDLRFGLKGGVVKFFGCRFVLRAPLTINSSAIESRGVDLFKTSKIIQKVHRSSENDRF